MQDLSLHLLDIIENSIRAQAKNLRVEIRLELARNKLMIKVQDDGIGMDSEMIENARNPFFTTKLERAKKIGLGIPLLAQNAESSGGSFTLESTPGEGTCLTAEFKFDHLDRPPLGNLSDTFLTVIAGHPEIEFDIRLERNCLNGKKRDFIFSTKKIRAELGEVPINYPDVLLFIGNLFRTEIKKIDMEAN